MKFTCRWFFVMVPGKEGSEGSSVYICIYIYVYPTMKGCLIWYKHRLFPVSSKKLTTTNNRQRLLIESHSLSMWVSPNDKPCIWGWLKYVEIPAMVIWIEDGANSIGWIPKMNPEENIPFWIPSEKFLWISINSLWNPYEIPMKSLPPATRLQLGTNELPIDLHLDVAAGDDLDDATFGFAGFGSPIYP